MLVRSRDWIIVWTVALGTRLAAAFLLPNAEQDGYSYAEIIVRMSAQFSAGTFRLTDLFGFWLPLFQVAAAILNLWIHDPLLAGKILSALCGAGSCILLFAIARQMTRSLSLAYLAFALVVFNPLHLLYSAACMTDVPSGCCVLASLWCVLDKRWVLAAVFGAAAESLRIEPWILTVLIPLIQFAYERRISVLALAILIFPPLAWLGISQLATGDPFIYFAERARYHAKYLDFYSTRQHFNLADVRQDVVYFLLGANRIAVLAVLATGTLAIKRATRDRHYLSIFLVAPLAYALAMFGFVVLAYITRQQPVLFPRYGLTIFVLALPILVWLIGGSIKRYHRSRLVKLIAVIAIALCLWETKAQLSVISKVVADFRAHQQLANTLAMALRQSPDREQRCFSDDVAVRVLSHLPASRFVCSATAPSSAWQNPAAFESYLEQSRVGYLVFSRLEDSLPVKFFPQLGQSAQTDPEKFQLITVAFSPFAPDVWLYRLRGNDP